MKKNIMKSFLYVIINNSLLATIIIEILSVIKNPTVGGLIGLLFIGILWFFSVSILVAGVSAGIEKIKEEKW